MLRNLIDSFLALVLLEFDFLYNEPLFFNFITFPEHNFGVDAYNIFINNMVNNAWRERL